uniref:Uncharacterized protein n=1 Tax=Oryza meridionalis TaxID=40149 RepID=A0A0E0C6N5_9ORYZ
MAGGFRELLRVRVVAACSEALLSLCEAVKGIGAGFLEDAATSIPLRHSYAALLAGNSTRKFNNVCFCVKDTKVTPDIKNYTDIIGQFLLQASSTL